MGIVLKELSFAVKTEPGEGQQTKSVGISCTTLVLVLYFSE